MLSAGSPVDRTSNPPPSYSDFLKLSGVAGLSWRFSGLRCYGYLNFHTGANPMPFLILSAGRDPDLLKTRNAALQAQGYRVAAAFDSYEVVDKLLNGDFDLVLLCHTMPEEDRRRLARIISRHTPSTPVILISQSTCESVTLEPGALQCSSDQVLATLTHSLIGRSGPWAA
jgi:CheY-like chemotaxis protein